MKRLELVVANAGILPINAPGEVCQALQQVMQVRLEDKVSHR